MNDFNWSVQQYDIYMKRKYAEALNKGETQAKNVLDYWEETTYSKSEREDVAHERVQRQ